MTKYMAVTIPVDLLSEVDKIVADEKHGFTSRAGFVKQAIYNLLKEFQPLYERIKQLEMENKRLKKLIGKEAFQKPHN